MTTYDSVPVEGLTFNDWVKVFAMICGTGLILWWVLWAGGVL